MWAFLPPCFTSPSWKVIACVAKDVVAASRFHGRAPEGGAPSASQLNPFVSDNWKWFLLQLSSPGQRKLQRSQRGVKPPDAIPPPYTPPLYSAPPGFCVRTSDTLQARTTGIRSCSLLCRFTDSARSDTLFHRRWKTPRGQMWLGRRAKGVWTVYIC